MTHWAKFDAHGGGPRVSGQGGPKGGSLREEARGIGDDPLGDLAMPMMIDSPSRVAPRAELLDFLWDMATYPQDDPNVKRAIAEVQGYLDEADRKAAASAKKKTAT
jgi:hypothetical protein